MNDNVILTGFMGTGKTTVGKLLAEMLACTFVDTDALIEAEYGPIPAIFATQGEAAFRHMERAVAKRLAAQQGVLIATGGGLMLDEANATVLGETGTIFCLTAPAEVIVARILADGGGAKRPLLASPNPEARIAALLEERRPIYGRFTQVGTQGKTAVEVAEEIWAKLPYSL